MKKIIFTLVVTFSIACHKTGDISLFSIDKAHYHYNRDPKGYSECSNTKLYNNINPIHNDSNPMNYSSNLVTDSSHFNWLFWYNLHHSDSLKVPNVDFNTQSFIWGKVKGNGEKTYIKNSKVLIDKANKKLLLKFLVKNKPGDDIMVLEFGYVIPVVTSDYEVTIDYWCTNY